MLKIEDFYQLLEEYAPLKYSYQMIEKGSYDNSGLLVKNSGTVNKVLFSLDLSTESVKNAIEKGCDTIVTHHPAIYNPIKKLSDSDCSAPLLRAVKGGISVFSMHLNLDVAQFGIDYWLCKGLGGENIEIIDKLDDNVGYGRQADVQPISIEDFADKVMETFKTQKVITYGDKKVQKIASFCGGGADNALEAVIKGETDADTIISSDIPHHVLKELVESGLNVVILPHYASEQYGFNKFYQAVKEKNSQIETFYYADKRFM